MGRLDIPPSQRSHSAAPLTQLRQSALNTVRSHHLRGSHLLVFVAPPVLTAAILMAVARPHLSSTSSKGGAEGAHRDVLSRGNEEHTAVPNRQAHITVWLTGVNETATAKYLQAVKANGLDCTIGLAPGTDGRGNFVQVAHDRVGLVYTSADASSDRVLRDVLVVVAALTSNGHAPRLIALPGVDSDSSATAEAFERTTDVRKTPTPEVRQSPGDGTLRRTTRPPDSERPGATNNQAERAAPSDKGIRSSEIRRALDSIVTDPRSNKQLTLRDALAARKTSAPILLYLWATWCKPCLEEMDDVEALQKTYSDILFVGLIYERGIPDNRVRVAKALGSRSLPHQLFLERDFVANDVFAVTPSAMRLPAFITIDASGSILHKIVGPIRGPENTATRESLVQALDSLSGKATHRETAAPEGN